MLSRTIIALVWFIYSIRAIPIDNGVEGEPEIECGSSTITVTFNTRNNFEGHVYVKGRFAEQGCRNDENGRKVSSITLPFADCGVERRRSLNPRGIFVSTTVVVTFHPQFLTKVDRAYTLQCFYMEADKTVSQELEVSEITTLFHSQQVPMPVCRYDILDGSPTGQPIKFALIGQQVYHKWTCTTETTDIFCMVVHDCFVDDGSGNKVNLLNENGCALDRFLLQNLEYSSDLMAGREAHVFKYADKAALFFQCQITITIKEPGQQCPRPQCPEPGGIGGGVVGGAGAVAPAGGAKTPAGPGGAKTPSPTIGAGGGAKPVTLRPQNKPPPGAGGGAGPAPSAKATGSPPRGTAQPPGQTGPPAKAPPSQGGGNQPAPVPQTPSPPGTPNQGGGNPAPTQGGGNIPAPAPQTPSPPGSPNQGGANLPGQAPETPSPPAPTAGIGIEAPPRRTKPPRTGQVSGGEPAATNPPGTAPETPAPIPSGGEAPTGGAAGGANVGSVPGQPPPANTGSTGQNSPTPPPLVNPPVQSGSVPPAQSYATNNQPTAGQPVPGGSVPPVQQPYGTNSPPQPLVSGPPQPIVTGPQPIASQPPPVVSSPPQPIVSGPPPAYGTVATAPPSYSSVAPPPQSIPPPIRPTDGQPPLPTGPYGGYAAGDLPLPLDFEVRKKRTPLFADEVGTWDLRAQPIVTFDIDDDSLLLQDLRSHQHPFLAETSTLTNFDDQGQVYCMTSVSLGLFLSFVVASVLTAIVFAFLFCLRKSGNF